MLLGALLDAGVSLNDLRTGLTSLPVSGWSLDAEAVHSHGLPGIRAKVKLTEPDQPHRGLGEVLRIIGQGSLPVAVTQRACAVFQRLGEVEAHIHATSMDEIEFHEVGASDALVDAVCAVHGLSLLHLYSPKTA